MDDVTLSYIAGVMDSDGYFSIRKTTNRRRNHGDAVSTQYFIRVGIKQVEPEAIDIVHSIFGGYRGTMKPNAKNGRTLNTWQATDRKAEVFVRAILPFLRIKPARARVLLDLRDLKSHGMLGKYENIHADRWGVRRTFLNARYSEEQLDAMEMLYLKIRGLNDTRLDVAHWPIP